LLSIAAPCYRQTGCRSSPSPAKECGSSAPRDWAADGTARLSVHAVLAESTERIRSMPLTG